MSIARTLGAGKSKHGDGRRSTKLGQDPVFKPGVISVALSDIRPAPENDEIYRKIHLDRPDIIELAKVIAENGGLLEMIVISRDGYIVSGHRRYAALLRLGYRFIRVKVVDVIRKSEPAEFTRMLTDYNLQRDKNFSERLNEELIRANPDKAHRAYHDDRIRRANITSVAPLEVKGTMRRCKISEAKMPMARAVKKIIEENKKLLPLSDRRIHYLMLNDQPLRHAKKKNSVYQNDKASYKDLCNLLTRMRLEGSIPFESISDETRPVTIWKVYPGPREFIREQLDQMFTGYWRDRQQSQINHIEILGEKNTLAQVIRPVASDFCIPVTLGRGFCSLAPRHAMAERFRKSGCEKLVVLIISDHDADGMEICESFARSMRDDFAIETVFPVKVAVTDEHVKQFKLLRNVLAKKKSSRYREFLRRYGKWAYEVEALPAETLQRLLREAIESVLEVGTYNKEVEAERDDVVRIAAIRKTAIESLKYTDFGEGETV